MNTARQTTGFTLVETLIAITIVTFATTGPLFTASQSITAAEIARDKLVASYLAQEALEYVRAMRDNTYLTAYEFNNTSTAFNTFITGSDQGSITGCKTSWCTFDPSQIMGLDNSNNSLNPAAALNTCSSLASCPPLWLSGANIYTQQNGQGVQTPFTRALKATDISATDEKIEVSVSWKFHNVTHTISIIDHLTPWQ